VNEKHVENSGHFRAACGNRCGVLLYISIPKQMFRKSFESFFTCRLHIVQQLKSADRMKLYDIHRSQNACTNQESTEQVGVAVQAFYSGVQSSNLSRDTGYPGRFSCISSIPPGKCRDSISIRLQSLPFEFLPTRHSLILSSEAV
jgi:hypothetical protein